jgi:hypothetical protein
MHTGQWSKPIEGHVCQNCAAPAEVYSIKPKSQSKEYWCDWSCKAAHQGDLAKNSVNPVLALIDPPLENSPSE